MIRPARYLAPLALVVVSSMATLFVLEYAVRLAIPQFDPSGHLSFVAGDDTRPTLGKPNTEQRQIKNTGDYDVTVRFNRHGFRESKDLSRSTLEDFFAVGDSLSFGWGVEEQNRITEKLGDILGRPVYNISIPGSIDRMSKLVRYAESQGAKIGNLIVFFSMEVRLVNTQAAARPRDVKSSGPLSFISIKNALMTRSALYFLITSLIHQNPSVKRIAIQAGLIQPNLSGFPYREFAPERIEATVRKLLRFAAPKDRRVIFAVLPARTLWIGPTQNDEDRTHRTLVRRLRESGGEVIDLRPAFEEGGKPLGLFFKNDGHWNPAGHVIVAHAVAAHLTKARNR